MKPLRCHARVGGHPVNPRGAIEAKSVPATPVPGLLDRPPELALGPAAGRTRGRTMTAERTLAGKSRVPSLELWCAQTKLSETPGASHFRRFRCIDDGTTERSSEERSLVSPPSIDAPRRLIEGRPMHGAFGRTPTP